MRCEQSGGEGRAGAPLKGQQTDFDLYPLWEEEPVDGQEDQGDGIMDVVRVQTLLLRSNYCRLLLKYSIQPVYLYSYCSSSSG